MCGGVGGWLGRMGRLVYFRCIQCGMDFSMSREQLEEKAMDCDVDKEVT